MWRYLFLLAMLRTTFGGSVPPCEQLGTYLELEVKAVARDAILRYAELLQMVIDSAEALDPNEMEQQILDNFAKFIEHTKQMDDSEDMMDLADELTQIFEFADSSESDEADDLIDQLMLQYHFDKFIDDLEKLLEDSFQRLEYHIEAYLRRVQRNKLLSLEYGSWLQKFKVETETNNKIILLEDFLDMFEC